ncbi:hypothetical protein LIER_12633 [Lithospermum erythrorhizon]|uniref:Uncharacterized protein n=1 Tax=Lithospermum erythrorhizon TaxID=34254 RepID=A0AAV3PT62_LITER
MERVGIAVIWLEMSQIRRIQMFVNKTSSSITWLLVSNSLDMNILDLRFFSAIQSLQNKESPKTMEELVVQAVVKAFNEYPSQKINHVWLTLQLCMQETLKVGGSNRYKIPHMKKEQLERNGQLSTQILCDPDVLQNAMNSLAS